MPDDNIVIKRQALETLIDRVQLQGEELARSRKQIDAIQKLLDREGLGPLLDKIKAMDDSKT